MNPRQIAALLALGGGALWLLRKSSATTLPDAPQKPPAAKFRGSTAISDFARSTARRESAGDLAAKNPRSSASGKYQFTRDTWLRLGGRWGNDPNRPFGGLNPSEAEQDARFAKLTRSNAGGLARAGLAATTAALYAAHFLGVAGAIRVLTAPPSTRLASLVGSKVIAANPHLQNFTAGDFRRWIEARA